jgi:formate/nitrite transporter FocA (FNT family)
MDIPNILLFKNKRWAHEIVKNSLRELSLSEIFCLWFINLSSSYKLRCKHAKNKLFHFIFGVLATQFVARAKIDEPKTKDLTET